MIRIGLGMVLGALSLACAPTIKYLEPVGDVSFPVTGTLELNAKLYRPQGGGPFPAVVLMQLLGAGGREHRIGKRCIALARLGLCRPGGQQLLMALAPRAQHLR